MRIRCGACHGSIWIQTADANCEQALATCGDCSQRYDVRPRLKDVDLYEFQRDAHEFARNAGVDLPAAYSVLLGITTLENVKDLYDQNATSGKASFDRSFADAVAAGTLSPQQAALRGKREAFAEKLVARHQISIEEALAVADNRTPLLEAVRRGAEVEQVEIEPQRRRFPFFRIALAAGAILAVAAIVGLTQKPDETAQPIRTQRAPKARRVIASLQEVTTNVVYNADGNATEVTGGNPEVVLDAYCRSVKGFRAEPVSLQAAGDEWNGLYRSRGVLYSIPIRWEPTRKLWVSGNAVDWVRGEPVTNP
jgi:hypothetical protein